MSLSFAEPSRADPKRIAQPGCKGKTKGVARANLAWRLRTAGRPSRRAMPR